MTTIYYKTSRDGRIIINLYTLDGRLVKTLVDENMSAGKYSVEWRGQNDAEDTVSSGIYLLHISAPGYKETKKICVIC
ncbi:T9SS type A sorting domain-containing protein [Patescibacteria group bacterium]|nr:T9SS type A sorting domain-containing protein [Patescibacteria group bacterium]